MVNRLDLDRRNVSDKSSWPAKSWPSFIKPLDGLKVGEHSVSRLPWLPALSKNMAICLVVQGRYLSNDRRNLNQNQAQNKDNDC